MRISSAISSLTSSLLLFATLSPQCRGESKLEWPYNLPRDVKYYPEDEPLVRKSLDIQRRLENEIPVALRKMSDDPGEMFFLDYWGFRDESDIKRRSSPESELSAWTNGSFLLPPQRPLYAATEPPSFVNRFLGRNLDKRDFSCPTNTFSCSSINRPNSCCPNGLKCNIVQDTGLGDVGCCGDSTCTGQVQGCPAEYTPCPVSQGGGCCVPGYQCSGVGCKS